MCTHHAGGEREQGEAQQTAELPAVVTELRGELQTLSQSHRGLCQQTLRAVHLRQPLTHTHTHKEKYNLLKKDLLDVTSSKVDPNLLQQF